MARKAVVAMSGGVDSSVAAALLVDQGYEVTGIMLKLWKDEAANCNSGCCNVGAADDARRVADQLGIPFYVLNFADRFASSVVDNFHDEYRRGRTPNPCVRCNQWIKFDALLDRAGALGADILATGHYARIERSEGRYRLRRGIDASKDQSYVLWMLTQHELARCMFPVGLLHKSETRRIAHDLGLRTAAKPDSQEICFVPGGDFATYATDHLPGTGVPGSIVDVAGNVVGRHDGISRFTVGQRRGLGISLGVPVFVTRIEGDTNTLVVGSRDDLLVEALRLEETAWTARPPQRGEALFLQWRAHGTVARGRAGAEEGTIVLDEPIEGVAPGQSAALYSGDDPDELIGGGIIAETTAATSVGPPQRATA